MSALGVHFRFVARCWNPSLLACRLLVVALVANGKGVKPLHLNRIGRVRMFGLLSQLWPALPEVDVLPVGAWAAPGGFTTNPGPLNVAGGAEVPRGSSCAHVCRHAQRNRPPRWTKDTRLAPSLCHGRPWLPNWISEATLLSWGVRSILQPPRNPRRFWQTA